METQLRGKTGVLLQDGWSSNQNDAVIAHCIRSGENTHLLSTNTPSTEKAGADYCFKEIEKAINDAHTEFNCSVVGVVTDNCSTMRALHKLILQKYPDIETIGCNPHLFNLLGKHFTPDNLKNEINCVQKFMKNHHYTVAAMKDRNTNLPILPGSTRWNSQIDSFMNYKDNHADYLHIARDMKAKDVDKKTGEQLEKVLDVLKSTDIYDSVESTINILEPICRALDAVGLVDTGIFDYGTGTT
jgi:hypothetical protein